jgi:hypothetical protein
MTRGVLTSWAADQETQTRVLIRRGDGSLDAGSITVSGDGEFALTDANGEEIVRVPAQSRVTVGREGDAFWVEDGDNPRKTGLAGPIRVNGTGDGAPLRNQSTSGGPPTSQPAAARPRRIAAPWRLPPRPATRWRSSTCSGWKSTSTGS